MQSIRSLFLFAPLLLFSATRLPADDLILKTGPAIAGVRAYVGTSFVYAVASDGAIQEVRKDRIKGLIRKPVRFSEDDVRESVTEVRAKAGRWRVAVTPVSAGRNTDPALAEAATDGILAEIVSTKRFLVVERAQVKKVIEEQALGRSGLLDAETGARMGQLLSASKLLSGAVSRSGEAISISARIIDVEKGRVEAAAQVTVAGDAAVRGGVRQLVRELLSGLSDPGSRRPFVFRSLALPGWGQLEDGGGVKAYSFFGLTSALLLYAGSSYRSYRSARQEYDSALIVPAGPDAGQDTLLLNMAMNDGKEARYRLAGARLNLSLAFLGAFWAYNVIDAALFPSGGNQPFFIWKEATRPIWFFAVAPEPATGSGGFTGGNRATLGITLRF